MRGDDVSYMKAVDNDNYTEVVDKLVRGDRLTSEILNGRYK